MRQMQAQMGKPSGVPKNCPDCKQARWWRKAGPVGRPKRVADRGIEKREWEINLERAEDMAAQLASLLQVLRRLAHG